MDNQSDAHESLADEPARNKRNDWTVLHLLVVVLWVAFYFWFVAPDVIRNREWAFIITVICIQYLLGRLRDIFGALGLIPAWNQERLAWLRSILSKNRYKDPLLLCITMALVWPIFPQDLAVSRWIPSVVYFAGIIGLAVHKCLLKKRMTN